MQSRTVTNHSEGGYACSVTVCKYCFGFACAVVIVGWYYLQAKHSNGSSIGASICIW